MGIVKRESRIFPYNHSFERFEFCIELKLYVKRGKYGKGIIYTAHFGTSLSCYSFKCHS